MNRYERACYAQAACCGHLEGKDRVGQYVVGEEILGAETAVEVHPHWGDAGRVGYQYGYVLAAQGLRLPNDLWSWELPEEAGQP